MIKIVCLIIISNAALICTESSKNIEATATTKETYQTRHENETVIQTDGNLDTGYVNASSENSNSIFSNVSAEAKIDGDGTSGASIPDLNEFNREEAEAEIKGWLDDLDCDTSPLGEFKCTLLKKLVKKFFDIKTEDIQLDKLKTRIRNLIMKLENGDTPIDPGMNYLFQKYKKFLV